MITMTTVTMVMRAAVLMMIRCWKLEMWDWMNGRCFWVERESSIIWLCMVPKAMSFVDCKRENCKGLRTDPWSTPMKRLETNKGSPWWTFLMNNIAGKRNGTVRISKGVEQEQRQVRGQWGEKNKRPLDLALKTPSMVLLKKAILMQWWGKMLRSSGSRGEKSRQQKSALARLMAELESACGVVRW